MYKYIINYITKYYRIQYFAKKNSVYAKHKYRIIKITAKDDRIGNVNITIDVLGKLMFTIKIWIVKI